MACLQEFSTPDHDIEATILQLQELELQQSSWKGKHAEGSIPDYDTAYHCFKDELQNHLSLLNDHKLAHSVAQAIDTDAAALEEIRADEYKALQDRMFVLRLSSEDPELEKIVPSQDAIIEDHEKGNAWWTGLATEVLESSDDKASPSTYTKHQAAAFNKLSQYSVECVACGDEKHPKDAISLSCEHIYCSACLKSLFIRATTDESLFPPKCCRKPIDLSLIKHKFSVDQLVAFEGAAVEFTTTNRTYCAEPSCGKFIPPYNVYPEIERALCPKCESETCLHCKNLGHGGECVENEALQDLLTLALTRGWIRCIGCKTMIERDIGYNHMTCKCSAEFCYICCVEWKNCRSELWEEQNLVRRVEEVVDREAIGDLPPHERHERVRQMRDDLVANHECTHPGKWEKRVNWPRKGYNCDVCGAKHYKYILACRRCHMTACEDCRRHRI